MKDFNFQLFGVLRGSTLRFDGSPLLYLTFYSNLSGRGVFRNFDNITLLHFYGDCTIASLTISDVHLVYCEVDMPIGTPSL